MEKRFSRHTGKLLAAAVGAAGLAGFGASKADASLIIDVRATGGSTGVLISPDGKSVTATGPGDTVTLSVFARVSGTNGINDEQLQSGQGSITSPGALKGNLSGGVVAPYNSGSANGSVQDLDTDGDLDIGSNGTTATGKISFRAAAPQPLSPTTDPNTSETLVYQATFSLTGGDTSASLNWIFKNNNGAPINSAALWFEDGNTLTSKNPTNSPASSGSPVVVSAGSPVPEPGSLGLLSLAGIGLLGRRRK